MNFKTLYGKLLSLITFIAGVDTAKKFDARFRFHRKLNLKHPSTLADKVSYIELHDQSPLAPMCTDKFAVRDYIAARGYGDILIPLLMEAVDSVDKVDFSILPETFILKATHGCRMNYVVKHKSQMDEKQCRKVMRQWMRTKYGTYSMEPHYLSIPPRIYAEKFIDDMTGLIDYKIHCMNGNPEFVMVCTERSDKDGESMSVKFSLFDMEWKPIDAIVRYKNEQKGPMDIPKPKTLERMIQIARDLSKGFKFVRVDLYEVNERVLFGEMTFSPAVCVFPYFSDEFNARMGEKLLI